MNWEAGQWEGSPRWPWGVMGGAQDDKECSQLLAKPCLWVSSLWLVKIGLGGGGSPEVTGREDQAPVNT